MLVRVGALGGDHRDAVLEMLHQIGGELFRFLADDLKFQGRLCALDHGIADVAAYEAVDDAADDRLELVTVDEEGYDGDHGVQRKADPGDVVLRVIALDAKGNDVGAAGAAVLAQGHAVETADDDGGGDRSQDGAVAVGRGVLIPGKDRRVHGPEGDHAAGEEGREKHALYHEFTVDQKPGCDQNGDVDDQVQNTGVNLQGILEHGGNAADASRGEAVREDQKRIGERGNDAEDRENPRGFIIRLPLSRNAHCFKPPSAFGGIVAHSFCKSKTDFPDLLPNSS